MCIIQTGSDFCILSEDSSEFYRNKIFEIYIYYKACNTFSHYVFDTTFFSSNVLFYVVTWNKGLSPGSSVRKQYFFFSLSIIAHKMFWTISICPKLLTYLWFLYWQIFYDIFVKWQNLLCLYMYSSTSSKSVPSSKPVTSDLLPKTPTPTNQMAFLKQPVSLFFSLPHNGIA